MFFKALAIITVFLCFFDVSGQKIDFPIFKKSDVNFKSISRGDFMVHVVGYSIDESVAQLVNVPSHLVKSLIDDGDVFEIKITGDSLFRLKGREFEEILFNQIFETFGYKVKKEGEVRKVLVATKSENFDLVACNSDRIVRKKISLINSTWIGECVSISEAINQVSKWTNLYILDETDDLNPYKLSLKHDNLGEIVTNLGFNYKIDLSVRERNLEIINIYPK